MRNTFENYLQIKVLYKHREIIKNLSNNINIVIKQDKGKGVVKIDRDKCLDKCLEPLDSEQFVKLNEDSTLTLENKVQQTIRTLNKNYLKKNNEVISKLIVIREVLWKRENAVNQGVEELLSCH